MTSKLKQLGSLSYILPSAEAEVNELLHFVSLRANHSDYNASLQRIAPKFLCQFHERFHSSYIH